MGESTFRTLQLLTNNTLFRASCSPVTPFAIFSDYNLVFFLSLEPIIEGALPPCRAINPRPVAFSITVSTDILVASFASNSIPNPL
eukprot:TRINITY_DN1169_c0_g1_i1.p1 TRINITY_DN1169_c0_g1~~TRINITY_DN1169_c0_g1_i1.p1  ORF type:complete len:86 (-),score=2.75 TRINITY_DN1169_c0_g1_i1:41-298(-)